MENNTIFKIFREPQFPQLSLFTPMYDEFIGKTAAVDNPNSTYISDTNSLKIQPQHFRNETSK